MTAPDDKAGNSNPAANDAALNGISANGAADPSSDLSAGVLNPSQRQSVNYALLEWNHKKGQRESLFSGMMLTIILLFILAGTLATLVVYHSVFNDAKLDWHVWVLVASFLLPPTVLSLILTKSVYAESAEKRTGEAASTEDVPAFALVKDCTGIAREFFKGQSS